MYLQTLCCQVLKGESFCRNKILGEIKNNEIFGELFMRNMVDCIFMGTVLFMGNMVNCI